MLRHKLLTHMHRGQDDSYNVTERPHNAAPEGGQYMICMQSAWEPEVRGRQELPLAPDDVGVTPTTPAIKWLRTQQPWHARA
jgi:hypothetical protein